MYNTDDMGDLAYAKAKKNSSQIADFAYQVKASETDDTAAIQAALTNYNTVFLPDESYTISDTLLVPSNRKLYGVPGKTKITAAAATNKALISNADPTNGNSGIILENLWFDGNKENQTIAFSCVDFTKATYCDFVNLWVRGALRTGTFPDVSKDGEGIVLRHCEHCNISGGKYYENVYDGIKLRESHYNTVTKVKCVNNGRAGLQVAKDIDGTVGSNHNTFSDIIVEHSTGIPEAPCPTTSGFYIHRGEFNTITNLCVYGTRQGIGLIEGANDNVFTGCTLRTRYVDKGVIDVETSDTTSNRNSFENIDTRPLSGVDGRMLSVMSGNYNRLVNCYFVAGEGSGNWTVHISNTDGTYIHSCYLSSSTVITDLGTDTQFKNLIGKISEKTGIGTVSSGGTSGAFVHGLFKTPSINNIKVTPLCNLGNATKFWINYVTASYVYVAVDQVPGVDITFSCEAKLS